MVLPARTIRRVRRRPISAAPATDGPRDGESVRGPLDRGSGGVTALVLTGAVVTLALGGLAGIAIVLRVTDAIREAELGAVTIATRALAGDPTPCEPTIPRVEKCLIDDGIATVRIVKDGVRATAVAGPER
jgi:hypothetical protein